MRAREVRNSRTLVVTGEGGGSQYAEMETGDS